MQDDTQKETEKMENELYRFSVLTISATPHGQSSYRKKNYIPSLVSRRAFQQNRSRGGEGAVTIVGCGAAGSRCNGIGGGMRQFITTRLITTSVPIPRVTLTPSRRAGPTPQLACSLIKDVRPYMLPLVRGTQAVCANDLTGSSLWSHGEWAP